MKTYILLSALIYGLCSSIYAAPSRKSRPAESVQLFYAAMSRGNIETAKKYVLSSKLWEKLNKLEASLKQIPELKKDIRKDYLPLTRAKYLTQSVRKDQGKVTYSYVKDKKTVTETVFLRFVDGKWRIEEIL